MSRSFKITKKSGRLATGFLVTKKPASGTKKPVIMNPGTTYEYVQSIATHYCGKGCASIKAKYSILGIHWGIFLIPKTADMGLVRDCKALWEGLK